MTLSFPRKFVRGQKMSDADVNAELHLWPDGRFRYMVHIRNNDPVRGSAVHFSFALLDAKLTTLGNFGMAAEELWSVGPQRDINGGRFYDELYGDVPVSLLKKTEGVALVFRFQDQKVDAGSLRHLATRGSELVCCPIPA